MTPSMTYTQKVFRMVIKPEVVIEVPNSIDDLVEETREAIHNIFAGKEVDKPLPERKKSAA